MNRKQARKKIEEWKTSRPPLVRSGDVEKVMDLFFERIPKAGGSHLLAWMIPQEIRCLVELQTGQSIFAPGGSFHVPEKSGKMVKLVYVRQAWMILDHCRDDEEEDSVEEDLLDTSDGGQGFHH